MGRRMPGLAAGRLRVLLGRSLREGRRLTLPGSPGSLQLLESALQRGFEFDHALAEFGHPLSEGGVLSRQFFVAGPRGVTCHNSIIHHCDTCSACSSAPLRLPQTRSTPWSRWIASRWTCTAPLSPTRGGSDSSLTRRRSIARLSLGRGR